MTSSTNFLSKAATSAAVVLILTGCACVPPGAGTGTPAQRRISRIAVLPVYNISAAAAPLKEIRKSAEDCLKARGVAVTDDAALEEFMAKHRIRYTGGVSREDSRDLRDGMGVDAVLITSLEIYSPAAPPKVALNMRLVSSGD